MGPRFTFRPRVTPGVSDTWIFGCPGGFGLCSSVMLMSMSRSGAATGIAAPWPALHGTSPFGDVARVPGPGDSAGSPPGP